MSVFSIVSRIQSVLNRADEAVENAERKLFRGKSGDEVLAEGIRQAGILARRAIKPLQKKMDVEDTSTHD
jgi:hypothetical protein